MLRSAFFLLLALGRGLAAAADEAESAPARVRALHFEGVTALPESELAARLETQAPGWLQRLQFWRPDPPFDPFALEADLERIPEIYREVGFFAASARADVDRSADEKSVRITIVVEEGEPVQLEGLDIELTLPGALPEAEWEEALDALPLQVGSVFGTRAYREAKEALRLRLAAVSHPAPAFEGGAVVDPEKRVASVRWRIDPGPRVRLGEVRVEGLDRVERELVTRELTFAPGELYDLEALRESERRLRETQLFSSVAIDVDAAREPSDAAASEAIGPVEIRVRERRPRSVSFGVGYGTEEQFRGTAAWRHRNFLGGGRKLEISGEYSALLGGGRVRFLQPFFLGSPPLALEAIGSGGQETLPAYDAYVIEGRSWVERRFGESWSARAGYLVEFVDVTKVAANEPRDDGRERVSAFLAGVRRQTLDDRLDPTRGSWVDLSAEPAFEALGSSASYVTFVADGRVFRSLFGVVAAARLRLGVVQPLLSSSDDDVPIFQRFFSGGSTSVRGYDYQKLPPLDEHHDPLGGLTLQEASVELRVPLLWRLSAVGFVDAGHLTPRPFDLRGTDVRFSAGPGLRVSTPLGPLRFDVGFPLDADDGQDPYRIHFAIGQAF